MRRRCHIGDQFRRRATKRRNSIDVAEAASQLIRAYEIEVVAVGSEGDAEVIAFFGRKKIDVAASRDLAQPQALLLAFIGGISEITAVGRNAESARGRCR